MVCKEEVFNWFKELSGAKRIELMCGLMSMCIPLEIRFFESIVKEAAKKDANALREAEMKANTFQEVDSICKCDLLADIAVNDITATDMKTNVVSNCEIQSNAIQSNCTQQSIPQPLPPPVPQTLHQSSQTPLQAVPIPEMTVAANGTTVLATNEMIGLAPPPTPSPANASSNLSQLPSRSKLVVSLCLMAPTNRTCSTIAFKALQHQLTAQQIGTAVARCLSYRKTIYELEDMLSGILLLLTMAVHHPAFSFEEKDLLAKQKEEVERTIDNVRNTHFRQSANYTANAIPFQTYGQHQAVHPGIANHIHPQHMGSLSTQPHSQSSGVGAGGQGGHSHPHTHSHLSTHQNVGQMSGPVPHQSSQQYASHPYMQTMPGTNIGYTSPPMPNMSTLRISNMTASPVSTPSPANSPSSSSKSTVTSVAAISPLPMSSEFLGHESVQNQSSYVMTSIPHPTLNEDMSCAKSLISCYNCGSIGHRGDECTTQTQEEANR